MAQTGNKGYNTLLEYYIDGMGNLIYTGTSKPNVSSDPDYIAPFPSDECPIDVREKIWLPVESSAYCEDGTPRPRIWIGLENTAYCETVPDVPPDPCPPCPPIPITTVPVYVGNFSAITTVVTIKFERVGLGTATIYTLSLAPSQVQAVQITVDKWTNYTVEITTTTAASDTLEPYIQLNDDASSDSQNLDLTTHINTFVNKSYNQDNIRYEINISDNTVENPLPDFDYLIIKYIWGSGAGRDLDTFSGFQNTGTSYDNDLVGYGQNSNPKIPAAATDDDAYIRWGGDNTGDGPESILINIKKFILDAVTTANPIEVRFNAVWWGERLTGDVTVEYTAYKGGTMALVGNEFVNTGGAVVANASVSKNVDTLSTSANIANSTPVAVLRFDPTTLTGTLNLV